MDLDKLSEFLVEAKRNTYAAHRGTVEPSRPGSKDARYELGRFAYLDSYFGDRRFSGQETVRFDGKPVWSMNYYGCLLGADPGSGFADFLKEALLLVPVESPYRGPDRHKSGAYLFVQSAEGVVDAFSGVETISYRGALVYRLWFHGGTVEYDA